MKDSHCKDCPAHSVALGTNPHVCTWDNINTMPELRQRVIWIVGRLLHNNPHPWCGFDLHFRLIVVRSALRAALGVNHGNEANYVRTNQSANAGRHRSGQERHAGETGTTAVRRSSLDYLAGAASQPETHKTIKIIPCVPSSGAAQGCGPIPRSDATGALPSPSDGPCPIVPSPAP